ncbi:MAG TPA: LPS export ABC transporter periplasmic protein LptC [Candidatus Acidoferrales bacterium]|nr:LPS export ABC transporter periplasmic protein LptC [Candidatus Acidoferrales bacterium]
MKGREAARLARWSAAVAVAIAVLAAGEYLHRRFIGKIARQGEPPPVPANVEQQSAQFSYAKVLGNRTLFTVRASRATQYKDQNRSMLEEVLITIFGRNGDRNDTISARECSYLPATGKVGCQGEVQIDLRNAGPNSKIAGSGMHLETRDISFDYTNEEVSTPSEILLRFPSGHGQATGVRYDTKSEVVRFENNVQLRFERSGGRPSAPVELNARSLEYRRNGGYMRLFKPVTTRLVNRTIQAGLLEVDLDAEMHPTRAIASKGVRLVDATAPGAASLTANTMEAILGARGAMQRLVADGNIHGEQKTTGGEQRFFAQHAEMMMSTRNGRSEPSEVFTTGDTKVEVQQKGVARRLETESLRAELVPLKSGHGAHFAQAQTLTPGEIVISQPGEIDSIRAGKFVAEFNLEGLLAKLEGEEGVKVERHMGAEASQVTTARNVAITFDGGRDWTNLREDGNVNFRQGDQTAQADQAAIDRATKEITLDGNAMVTDAASSTSAAHIQINQSVGEMHANGSVVTNYVGTKSAQSTGFSTATFHISADKLDASSAAGCETYSGDTRLWQGDAVLDADTIELCRDQKKLEARGDVRGVIPEATGKADKGTAPILWQIRAPQLEDWSDLGKLDLTGGVQAKSQRGAISGQSIEFQLAPNARKEQRLQRAVAQGGVRIESNGRLGTADRGEYTADQGKFTLSGGQPTLSDALGNTTTGHELTFFLANDTILVDSQKGSRTVTKHRVEK